MASLEHFRQIPGNNVLLNLEVFVEGPQVKINKQL